MKIVKQAIRVLTLMYPFNRGVWRIARLAGPWMGGGAALVVSKRRIWLLLRLENYIDRILYMFGKYEEDLVEFLISEVRSRNCDIFIDVGANLGYYSLAVDKTGAVGEVHCFEPDPVNLVMLRANILLNGADRRVTVHPFAATDRECELRFGLQRDSAHMNTGLSRVLTPGEGGEGEVITVRGVPVDQELPLKGRRIAIKIDVEGAEIDTLNGMKALLTDNRCILQIEIWPKNSAVVSQLLEGFGYKMLRKIGEQDYFWTNMS